MSALVVQNPMLLRIDAARRALAEAKTMDEVKMLRDQAQAVQHYLKQREGCFEAQQDAAEIKLRAERRLGSLLAETVVHGSHNAKLPEGVSAMQAVRWRRVSSIPEPDFEQHVAESRKSGSEITTLGAMRLAKQLKKDAIAGGKTTPAETCTVADLHKLVSLGKKFGTVYADPPWQYGNQATRACTDNHYPTMTVEEIAALPVRQLTADECHLHLWTTNAFLFECPRILDAWGFEYKSLFVWVKPQMGIGNYWRVSHELLVLGVKGSGSFLDHSCMSWLQADRTGHSSKPHVVRKLIEKVSPGPRLELFSRDVADGWVVWGNSIERGMFDDDVRSL
jgi:N6-adenosine-specific RNA methylase IME4